MFLEPAQIFESASQVVLPHASPNGVAGAVNWELPPEARRGWGLFKLNVHVAIDANRGSFGLGTMVPKDEGQVMVSGVHKCTYVDEVDFNEAEAFCCGLQLNSDVGLCLLLVESNPLFVVKLALGEASTCTEFF